MQHPSFNGPQFETETQIDWVPQALLALQHAFANLRLRFLYQAWNHIEGYYRRNKLQKNFNNHNNLKKQAEEGYEEIFSVRPQSVDIRRSQNLHKEDINQPQSARSRSYSTDSQKNSIQKLQILNQIAEKLKKRDDKPQINKHLNYRLTRLEDYLSQIKRERAKQETPLIILQKKWIGGKKELGGQGVQKVGQKQRQFRFLMQELGSMKNQLKSIRKMNQSLLKQTAESEQNQTVPTLPQNPSLPYQQDKSNPKQSPISLTSRNIQIPELKIRGKRQKNRIIFGQAPISPVSNDDQRITFGKSQVKYGIPHQQYLPDSVEITFFNNPSQQRSPIVTQIPHHFQIRASREIDFGENFCSSDKPILRFNQHPWNQPIQRRQGMRKKVIISENPSIRTFRPNLFVVQPNRALHPWQTSRPW